MQIYKYKNIQVYKYTNIVYKYINIQIYKYTNIVYKYINIQMDGLKKLSFIFRQKFIIFVNVSNLETLKLNTILSATNHV